MASTPRSLTPCCAFARVLFESGDYARAGPLLGHYRQLGSGAASSAAQWGRLACDILLQHSESALAQLQKLKELADSKAGGAAAERLHKRVWLAHWALFVLFGHPQGASLACDWFLDDKYLEPVHSAAPHLARYLCAAAVLAPRARQLVRDVLVIVERHDDVHGAPADADEHADASERDPVVVFLRALYVLHDFDGARDALVRCEAMLKADFFLGAHAARFLASARALLFEAFCRVHERVDVARLAALLGLDAADANRWLVDMIRDAGLDAKIDAAQNQVVLARRAQTPHERVVAQTKGLAFRSTVLCGNLARVQAQAKAASSS
eukprot:TRINITY_DN9766_c0_g1_i1.p2 TRINITY_DN9766_c0_g1~~TRINITY_DN9766_c0_g1_i1.p2  ORF type:complete len:324 (+),score=244.95 TRINITY_DN9766_c0_g1_i1:350-1321(+)